MVSLDQVKLLENKVAKTIEYVGLVIGENAALRQKEAELQAKLEAHQKRIDELESLISRFKEDQSRIEGGILSALERLNRFEDAIEKTTAKKSITGSASATQPVSAVQPSSAVQPLSVSQPVSASEAPAAAPVKKTQKVQPASTVQPAAVVQPSGSPKKGDAGGNGVFFEIAETEAPEDAAVDSSGDGLLDGEDTAAPADRELDIF